MTIPTNEFALDSILCYGNREHDPTNVNKLITMLKTPCDHKNTLADFVYDRLTERYITPFKNIQGEQDSSNPNAIRYGFSIMANMCLLIETLQSFRKGLKDSNRQSENLFREFFKDNLVHFPDVNSTEFYKNVRCGILHQGETTGGWKINHVPIERKTINAILFLEKMETILDSYKQELQEAEPTSPLWNNYLLKLHAIIQNCKKNPQQLQEKSKPRSKN